MDVDELPGELQFSDPGQARSRCLMRKSVPTKSRAKSHQVLVKEPIAGALVAQP